MAEDGFHQDQPIKTTPPRPTTPTNNATTTKEQYANSSFNSSVDGPSSPRKNKNPFSRVQTSLYMDDYFVGPRDTSKHSKYPWFMRVHGSILPEMVLPLLFVAGWSTLITCISKFVYKLQVNPLLLTVLGFVVGLGLSFRSSTAYERYAEGRKYWSQLALSSHNLARVFWIHANERIDTEENGKSDLFTKITGMNLLVAFAVALKHRLRFEPYTHYEDLSGLVGHLDTFAKAATTPEVQVQRRPNALKNLGQYLGVSFAESNPRKTVKKATKPLGNLPLEILSYLGAFVDELVENGNLKVPMHQTLAYNNLASLNDCLTGTDRILNTPLPVAYSIAIAQITWVYVVLLPFQLYAALGWVTIPGSIFAAYIILGIMLIGREIENPFGNDVNDLPLDQFCLQIAQEIDYIAAIGKKPSVKEMVRSADNKLLFPLSDSGFPVWEGRGADKIREELKTKVLVGYEARKSMHAGEGREPVLGEQKV